MSRHLLTDCQLQLAPMNYSQPQWCLALPAPKHQGAKITSRLIQQAKFLGFGSLVLRLMIRKRDLETCKPKLMNLKTVN
jgi:hypothetical protein